MMMKRSRDGEAEDISAMANCLMLLSSAASGGAGGGGGGGDYSSSRVFTCKTCNKQFTSFQALGGHRASHKKPRLAAGDVLRPPSSPPKPKSHECSICGLEFPLGQALGGHMRRHRAADQSHQQVVAPPPLSLFPVVKKPNNRRVFCLDLNLTPLENKFFLIASSQI